MAELITRFHDEELTYDGTQLRSHFAYARFGILGDSAVAFVGPCRVESDKMVDLEDAHRKLFISSDNMLHFIVELFTDNLELTIASQLLLVANAKDLLEHILPTLKLRRTGNDLFDDDSKLSVSIATRSTISTLIHFGINVSSKNTPVKTRGLEDYKISPQKFAEELLNRFQSELAGIAKARRKVRSVP